VHPDDQRFYTEHQQIIHEAAAGPITVEYRLIARDGSEHWLEHICRPIFGTDNRYLGRRVSNRDITQRKLAEKMLAEQAEKESILTETIKSIETDIARDLHDTLGQNISFLRMNLEHLSETQWSEPTYVKTQIQNMTKAANESYDLVRAMLFVLHFGISGDLYSLFSRYAEQVADRSSIVIDITNQGDPRQVSPAHVRQLFYIVREALSNIEKYASADRAAVEFTWNEHDLTLVISDNGRGFDPDAIRSDRHYGLKFMRERTELLQGSFSVRSAPEQGTTVTIVVPYEYKPIPPPH
jgi:signal transduction histidine kinase